MRIDQTSTSSATQATAQAAAAAAVRTGPARRDVEAQRTRASMPEIKTAIGRAYQSLYGRPPSKPMLDTLTAQAALETGRGESMFNYNFGGIKGTSPTGETAHYKTREVVDGKSIHVVDGFRAYRSLEDGAKDFVALLSRRYAPALERAEVGDVTGYAEKLRASGYYTAPVSEYSAGLTRIVGELGGTSTSGTSGTRDALRNEGGGVTAPIERSAQDLPTMASLDRFMDLISGSRASSTTALLPFQAVVDVARIAAPLEDDGDYG